MARGVTQEQVNRAADAVLQRGDRPTIEKVRAELGTGSPNTLIRLLDVWWASLAQRLAAQARANLPGLPDQVQRAMLTVWSEAVVAARNDANNTVVSREQELEQQLAAQATQGRELESNLRAAKVDLERIRAASVDTGTQLAAERERNSAQQSALAQALRAVDDLQRQLGEMRNQANAVDVRHRHELDRAEAAEQRWLLEVDRAREELKDAERRATATTALLERERKGHRAQTDRHREEIARLKVKLQAATKKTAKELAGKEAAAGIGGRRGKRLSGT